MKWLPTVALAAAVLLMVPSATAVGAPVSVATSTMHAEGVVDSVGRAIAIEMDGDSSADLPSAWHLEAEKLEVEVEFREWSSAAPGVEVSEDDRGRRSEGHYERAVVSPMTPVGHPKFFLASQQATSTIAASALDWRFSRPHSAVENGVLDPDGPREQVDFSSGLQPSLERGSIRVEGDLVIMVWDWDVHVSSRSGSAVIENGYSREPAAEPAPSEGPGTSSYRQAYLYAKNATFTLDLEDTLQVRVMQAVQEVEVDGELAFPEPDRVEGLGIADAGDLVFRGRVTATTGSADQEMQELAIGGEWDEVSADGNTIALPDADDRDLFWWPGLLAGGAVIPASVGGLAARRRWLRVQVEELEADLDLGEYKKAVARADKLLKAKRTRADAALMKTVALLRSERVDEAQAFLDSRPWPGPLASWHYLKATAEASQGNEGEARSHLDQCLKDAPEFAIEVEANPLLLRLMQAPKRDSFEGYH